SPRVLDTRPPLPRQFDLDVSVAGRSGARRPGGPARSWPLPVGPPVGDVVLCFLLEAVGARPRPLLDLLRVDEVEQPARVGAGTDEQLAASSFRSDLVGAGLLLAVAVDSSRSASSRCSSALRRS